MGKGLEGSSRGVIEALPGKSLRDWGKSRNTSVGIAGGRAETGTDRLQNPTSERSRYVHQLDWATSNLRSKPNIVKWSNFVIPGGDKSHLTGKYHNYLWFAFTDSWV
jgi:hypothetical protein